MIEEKIYLLPQLNIISWEECVSITFVIQETSFPPFAITLISDYYDITVFKR
ncbi:unnamed protein product [Brugia timori]|uniref:Uncharacterized protein n=1 Tax=Brugia timori TaxID=42155 RepID=A0A0R3QZV2_9BILA|nr:unnamed protein product [Brugia timori]